MVKRITGVVGYAHSYRKIACPLLQHNKAGDPVAILQHLRLRS
jgi:hypothetical protein